MDVTFDPGKDAANVVKHGLSLALALRLEWSDMLSWQDQRRDYGEVRMSGLARGHRVLLGRDHEVRRLPEPALDRGCAPH